MNRVIAKAGLMITHPVAGIASVVMIITDLPILGVSILQVQGLILTSQLIKLK